MSTFTPAGYGIPMIISIRRRNELLNTVRAGAWAMLWTGTALLLGFAGLGAGEVRADTVASLLGNFTINQYCGLTLTRGAADVHYAVVFGQLPALRELHLADTNGDGVTSQAERDAYVGQLAPGLAEGLKLEVAGVPLPLRVTHWASSLPTEQGGFSLRVDVDLSAVLPAIPPGGRRRLQFINQNYSGLVGWHEIVVQAAPGLAVFDTNAYSTSLTGGLTNALQSLPSTGPLDERAVHLTFAEGGAPAGAAVLAARAGTVVAEDQTVANGSRAFFTDVTRSPWIERETRSLVDAISGPTLDTRIAVFALLGAMLLGVVHALSPGHGKTIVGAYLIGSRGTPRHAVFLGSTVTITHTLGVFVTGFATLYASRFIVPERLFPILSLISALLVLGMGALLLVQRTRLAYPALSSGKKGPAEFQRVASANGFPRGRGLIFAQAPGHDHGHLGTMHSHGGAMHSHLPPGAPGEKVTWRSLLTLGISGGLVPCPSAMVLLLAAVALNKTAYGMLLVVAFSVGLAITLTAVGLAFLYARNRFRKPRPGARWPQLLPVWSAGMITALGIGLCFAALRNF
jgi:ABC-type nickel/cobalt efflux system permease component RcnA